MGGWPLLFCVNFYIFFVLLFIGFMVYVVCFFFYLDTVTIHSLICLCTGLQPGTCYTFVTKKKVIVFNLINK